MTRQRAAGSWPKRLLLQTACQLETVGKLRPTGEPLAFGHPPTNVFVGRERGLSPSELVSVVLAAEDEPQAPPRRPRRPRGPSATALGSSSAAELAAVLAEAAALHQQQVQKDKPN